MSQTDSKRVESGSSDVPKSGRRDEVTLGHCMVRVSNLDIRWGVRLRN